MTQIDDDAVQAVLCARNCLLYERDGGPAMLNVGSAAEPRLVPRAEAWQHAYAIRLLVDCDGDHPRLTAASRKCREDAGNAQPGSPRARLRSRAADLCDQAVSMIAGAGAVDDDKARRSLVAACQHESTVIAIGVLPGVAANSAAALAETLRKIDEGR